jgi:L-amino acid N-acyltransferase YncA
MKRANPIRLASPEDARPILNIFTPYIRDSAISFMTEAPNETELREKIGSTLLTHPWIVWEEDGRVLGYANASKHRVLGAYRWCAEVSIYVAQDFHRRGIARSLYDVLLRILKAQGFYNAYAGITLPNPASIAFHESFGFRRFCVFESIGFKLGKWHDVGWWKLELQDQYTRDPADPIPMPEWLARQEMNVLWPVSSY